MSNSSSFLTGINSFLNKSARTFFESKTKYTITDGLTNKTIQYTIPLVKDDILEYSFLQVNKASFYQNVFDILTSAGLVAGSSEDGVSLTFKDYTSSINTLKKYITTYNKSKTGNVVHKFINYTKDDPIGYTLSFTNLPKDDTSAYVLAYQIKKISETQTSNSEDYYNQEDLQDIVYIEANDLPGVQVTNATTSFDTSLDYSPNIIKKGAINTPINKTLINKTLINKTLINNTLINNTPINKKAPIGKNTFRNLIFN